MIGNNPINVRALRCTIFNPTSNDPVTSCPTPGEPSGAVAEAPNTAPQMASSVYADAAACTSVVHTPDEALSMPDTAMHESCS